MTDNIEALREALKSRPNGYMPYMPLPVTFIRELLDRLEAAEKDAARYRWLRPAGADQACLVMNHDGDGLDAAIDAAMQEKQQ